MYLLYETPAGYSIFKVNDPKKLQKTDAIDIYDTFFSDEKHASKMMNMIHFQPYTDMADAVVAATSIQESSVSPSLKQFLQKTVYHKKKKDTVPKELIVADKMLGTHIIKESILSDLKIVHDTKTNELYRGIRTYFDTLLQNSDLNMDHNDMIKMQLGLSHSLSRYKLKFSADKIDTMIIQAVGLLDELDKEINTYAMRVKEWYGWHFPELQSLLSDNMSYCQLVHKIGYRVSYHDKADIVHNIIDDEVLANTIVETAEISMGTDITDMDLLNIQSLCDNVISMTEYRKQLYEYLCSRMNSIAPNLTILVGELVGARLISHAGSLLNLAKQPASTIQILGAEKALFRALKTKSNTPKYGLIYHASLIGQASAKHKGKISRILAAKAALSIRVDALSDDPNANAADDGMDMANTASIDTTIGFEGRAKVEARLRQLESGYGATSLSSSRPNITAKKVGKYDPVAAKMSSTAVTYNPSNDIQMDINSSLNEKTTDNGDDDDDDDDNKKKSKKDKKKEKKAKKDEKKRKLSSSSHDASDDHNTPKKGDDNDEDKKKKKRKVDGETTPEISKEQQKSSESDVKKKSKKDKKDKKERKSI